MSLLVIHYGLEFFARRLPDKTAVVFQDHALSFRQLNVRANRVAHALRTQGLQRGERVAAFLDNCLEYPEIIYGCSKAGVVLVPINYRLTAGEAQALLRHSEARIAFISARLDRALQEHRQGLTRSLPHGMITVGGPVDSPQGYHAWIEGRPDHDPGLAIDERDPFYIGYTSGTTGKPKGALVSHRARALLTLAWSVEYGLNEDDVNLTPGAIYHAAPLLCLLQAINTGSTCVIMEKFDPEEMLRLTEAHRATNAFVAPTMLEMILRLPPEVRARYRLGSMRALISAGAPLPTHTKEATRSLFGEQVLHEYYGSTEAGWNTNLRPRDQMRKPRSCGKAVLGWEVKLVGDDGRDIDVPGQIGEIHVRGEYMFDGYIGNPEATAAAFRDGWFSADDLGYFDEEGYWFIVGRKKDMILSGGANVYPEEIEDCLHGCPGVADVAVIGVPDETWGERVTAIVALTPDSALSPEDIRNYCDGRIAGYKKPRQVHFVDEIPRNPSGKITKNVLRKRFAQAP